MRKTFFNKLFHNERLEKLYSHFFRKTALIYFKFGSYDDNRTSGIVDTFSEKVLTETSLFTFQHIRKRFKRSVSGTCNRSSSTAVIYKRVNSFLEHSLFISYNDVGSAKFKKSLKTIISVYYPSVKVIKVACCKSSAVKLNHRTYIGRNNRDSVKYHPLRLISGKSE